MKKILVVTVGCLISIVVYATVKDLVDTWKGINRIGSWL